MGATIVLADDEADLRAIYSATLREAGHEVWEAADGGETIAAVRERRPDLLLLDVWMPVLNGFEVLERLSHDPLSGSVKVVMLSNLDDADSRLEGFSLGVVDYWVKGLSLVDLRQEVGRVLAGAGVAPGPG